MKAASYSQRHFSAGNPTQPQARPKLKTRDHRRKSAMRQVVLVKDIGYIGTTLTPTKDNGVQRVGR